MPAGLVRATSSETGMRTATFLPVICLTPTASSAAGFTPPSPTQSASGMSIGTGIAVLAFTDSGTRRASCCTADCSLAFAKIGPVMVGGSRVLETLESCTAMTARSLLGERAYVVEALLLLEVALQDRG